MKIAIEGCAHGELDKIYQALEHITKENNIKVDLLIICGDFQAVRNPTDLECMAVPPKYRKLNTFYKYYSGAKVAPVLTIFIGGNHEASNYLSELSYGGWVCPNIYYLGYANVINICGIRIAGLSGIYKGRDYLRGHFECPPYDESSKKSAYHVRNIDVFRLKQISNPIDIFISHDWPTGVYNFGNTDELLRWKPFFKDEMRNNVLGSKPAEELLMNLKPSYWFAAHLHCKFSAVVPHNTNGKKSFTKFLALDKCLPRRKFLQIIDIESSGNPCIEYDGEWLSILQLTNHLLSVSKRNVFMPGKGCLERWNFTPSDNDIKNACELLNNDLKVPQNFCITAPCYVPEQGFKEIKLKPFINPQTQSFCSTLKITDPLVATLNSLNGSITISDFSNTDFDSTLSSINPDEIEISDEDVRADIEKSATDLNFIESGDFFIDKVGSNSSTNNYPRISHTPDSSNLDLSFPEIKEDNLVLGDANDNCSASENPRKKFKRRNWSLYKSDDN